MATNDGYAPYPLGLTASEAVTAITRAFNMSTELENYQYYYTQSALPTTVIRSGDLWRDEDSNKVYMSTLEGSATIWLEV